MRSDCASPPGTAQRPQARFQARSCLNERIKTCKTGIDSWSLTAGDLLVALALSFQALLSEGSLCPGELGLEERDLALAQVHVVLLTLILLGIDVVLDVLHLTLALINGRIQLHGLLGRVLQVLLEVGDLTREFALGRAVLSVLLLDLGQVLELDRLALEDAALHILNELLLLLAEELVLELHAMDLLLHRHDLRLADGRVKRILHLFFKLILALLEFYRENGSQRRICFSASMMSMRMSDFCSFS